jgi:hypothetical protein
MRPPLDLSFLVGVRGHDFERNSHLHGASHVNRVIVLGQYLAREVGVGHAETKALWAAAFLHDLERKNDGDCYEHGRWAAENRLDDLTPLFRSKGVTSDGLEEVRSAVTWHSQKNEPPKSHPHYSMIALLKDADCLDRWRIDDLNPDYLRYKESHRLLEFSQGLYEETEYEEEREDFDFIQKKAARLTWMINGPAPKPEDHERARQMRNAVSLQSPDVGRV